jgi:hypothetical protein
MQITIRRLIAIIGIAVTGLALLTLSAFFVDTVMFGAGRHKHLLGLGINHSQLSTKLGTVCWGVFEHILIGSPSVEVQTEDRSVAIFELLDDVLWNYQVGTSDDVLWAEDDSNRFAPHWLRLDKTWYSNRADIGIVKRPTYSLSTPVRMHDHSACRSVPGIVHNQLKMIFGDLFGGGIDFQSNQVRGWGEHYEGPLNGLERFAIDGVGIAHSEPLEYSSYAVYDSNNKRRPERFPISLLFKILGCTVCLGLFLRLSYKGLEFMDFGKDLLGVAFLLGSIPFCVIAFVWLFAGHIVE